MQINKKKLTIYLVIAFLVGALVTGSASALIYNGLLGYVKVSTEDYKAMSGFYEKYGKLAAIEQTIEQNYYTEYGEDALLDGACHGLVAGLGDPYSAYMTVEEYESWEIAATGEYSGVGITFAEDKDGNYLVMDVQAGSPAKDADVKEGDYILTVDGEAYEDMEQMAMAIRGEAGTKVKLGFQRDGENYTVEMEREEIVQRSVEYEMLDGKVGYLKISSFLQSTGEDAENALKDLEKQGATSLVLDLRDNGGGLVDACVQVTDLFLDAGIVTYVEDKNGKRTDFNAEDGKTDLETVVLINESSASASEILAAALQDNGFATVGTTSFGKGVIQSTAELEDGSALKLTVMQYFSPKGNAIHEKGVEPEYPVDAGDSEDADPQLDRALQLLR